MQAKLNNQSQVLAVSVNKSEEWSFETVVSHTTASHVWNSKFFLLLAFH